MSDFSLRHGEAVAIGVAVDTIYSSLVYGLDPSVAQSVLKCLTALGFSLTDPAMSDIETLFGGLEEFRQHLGGRLTLTMVPEIGKPIDIHSVEREQMIESIKRVQQFADTQEAFTR